MSLCLLTTTSSRIVNALIQTDLLALNLGAPQQCQVAADENATFAAAVQIISQIRHRTTGNQTGAAPTHDANFARQARTILKIQSFTRNHATLDRSFARFAKTRARNCMHAFAHSRLNKDTDKTDSLDTFAQLRLSAVGDTARQSITRERTITYLSQHASAKSRLIAYDGTLKNSSMTALTIYVLRRDSIYDTIQVMFSTLGSNESTVLITARISRAMILLIAAASVANNSAAIIIATTELKFLFRRQYMKDTFIRLLVRRLSSGTAADKDQFTLGSYRSTPLCSTLITGSES